MTDWLSPSRWRELEPHVDAALDCSADEREVYVQRVHDTDPSLHAELQALLQEVDRAAGLPLLEGSASGVFSSLLREDPEAVKDAVAGALAGRYALERQIGAGGMATVYLATDLRLQRKVAIKVLHPDLSQTLGAERFAREIRLVATLEHPHIVGVLDSGSADGHLWFAMPFIDGESLRERLVRGGQLPLDDALLIVQQAADALAFAHAHGVIHRDIKPDNIMLSGAHAYVADFGIARAVESTEALTRTGMSIGTPAYMAPEQATGEKQLDERVDIYALGSVLYEMLAGTTAFSGPSAQAIIVRAMTTDPQPIHPIRTAVTPALDAVILKAMSRTPADRYARMEAFASAVSTAAVSTERAGAAAAPRAAAWRSHARRQRFGIGVGVALVLAAGATYVMRNPVASAPRLAILPFENRSRDADDAYLAEGFTEEIGNTVARVPNVAVLSNTAVRRVTDASLGIRQMGKLLGASYLMSGSVQRIGGRLRVSVELARASTGERVWSDRFDRTDAELPALLHDIAVATATGMLGTLPPAALARLTVPTTSAEAYDLYLRGSHTRFSEGNDGLQQSIAAYEAALAIDPTFAAALGRLAAVYSRARFWNVALPGMTPDTVSALAEAASTRALQLDSTSADAWAARGNVLFFKPEPDYAGAVSALGRAAALDSLNASVHFLRGHVLRRLGDFAGAERATHAAIRMDPTLANSYNQMALILYTARRYGAALAYSDSAVAGDTGNWQYREIRSRIHTVRGDTLRARTDAEQSVLRAPVDQREYAQMILAQARAAAGDTAGARTLLNPILAKIPPGKRTPRDYQLAISFLVTGQSDQALALLERIEPRGAWLWSYMVMPTFDPLRSHPRFVKLLNDSRPPGVAAVQ